MRTVFASAFLFALCLAFAPQADAQRFDAPRPPGMLIAYDAPPAVAPAQYPPTLAMANTPDGQTPPNPSKGQPYGVPPTPSKQNPPAYGSPPVPPKNPPLGVPPTYATPQQPPAYGTPQTYGSPQGYGAPQCPPCQTTQYGYAPPDPAPNATQVALGGGANINTKRRVVFKRNTGLGNLGASGPINVNNRRKVIFKNNSF